MGPFAAHRPDQTRFGPPPRGGDVVVHDATFEAWDTSFSLMRDIVNQGVDVLNEAGAGLRHLPRGSLQELLVLPLSGDYGAIRGNAVACGEVGSALRRWSLDLGRVSVDVAGTWSGQAAATYLVRATALALAVAATGELVDQGARVLHRIATRAEQYGVRVEQLVVDLGRTLVRLVRRILTRVGGPAGWALLAVELVTEGLSTVTDIIDDVRRVVHLVDTLLELRDTIRDWAHDVRHDLEPLLELRLLGQPYDRGVGARW